MAAPMVEKATHPGDSMWSTNRRQSRGRRRRRRPFGPSVSAACLTEAREVPQGRSEDPEHVSYQGKEPHTLATGSGSTNARADAMPPPQEGDKRLPPHLRGKSIPHHLRRKYEHSTDKNTAAADQGANATAVASAGDGSSSAKTNTPASPTVTGPSRSSHESASSRAPAAASSTDKKEESGPQNPSSSGANGSAAYQKANTASHASSRNGKEPSGKSYLAALSSQQRVNAHTSSSKYSTEPGSSDAAVAGPSSLNGQDRRSAGQAQHGHHYRQQDLQGRGRGRGRGRGGRDPQRSQWLRNRDIPKPDPTRWDINWESEQDNCSVDTAGAESGMGNDRERTNVNPGIDPETGFILTDYSGNWGPAPVDWDSRPAYRSGQSTELIDNWMERTEQEMFGTDCGVPQEDFVAVDGVTYHFAPDPKNEQLLIQGTVAPRYWPPVVVGNMSASAFWERLLTSTKPKTYHEGDLKDARPWWETYQSAWTLTPYDQPEIKGIDPKETNDERLKRENDLGSLHHAENRKRAERAKIQAKRDRQRQKEERAKRLNPNWPTSPPAIKVGLKLYLRPAREEDMQRVSEIYNYYIEHTVCVHDLYPLSEIDMMAKCVGIRRDNFPFFVACERGEVKKGRKRNHYEDLVLPDKVVGFACAENVRTDPSMYRFSCTAKVFVDPSYYMKGIGKCLFDKLLGLLDPAYLERGGYDVEGDELEGPWTLRVVSKILAIVPYEKAERLEWKGRFLTEGLGFQQVENVEGIATKFDQSVNVATFIRTTGTQIDPAHPPVTSGGLVVPGSSAVA